MTIRIYNDKIRFTDGTNSVDLLVESDGLRFTGSLTVNANSTFVRPIAIPPPSVGGEGQKYMQSDLIKVRARISEIFNIGQEQLVLELQQT